MRYILLTIIFGLVAPFIWTPLVSNLYAIYVPGTKIGFWVAGAAYSLICALVVAGPLGWILPKMNNLHWVLFATALFVATTVGMALYGGLGNFTELWGNPNTWFFVLGTLAAMHLGFNLKCRLTNRSRTGTR